MPVPVLYSRPQPDEQRAGPLLLIHGGAGPRSTLGPEDIDDYRCGLEAALTAGSSVLRCGQSALDGACAAVTALEDNPLFNAGRGASLTLHGTAEMDAAVMAGDGQAGAVAVSRHIRNPILGARAVMERTSHVLLFDPEPALAAEWGLETEPQEYFVTEQRRRQLRSVLANREAAPRCGTVGAVALDMRGHVACATSTGGMVGQAVGRVGDTALVGAGSFAANDAVAISCTGEGEAYIRGVVAYDIVARLRYERVGLEKAVHATYAAQLEACGAAGGSIAVTPAGEAVIAHNSKAMFAGYWTPNSLQTFV